MRTVKNETNAKKVKHKVERTGKVYVVEVGYTHNKTIAEALMKSLRHAGFDPVLRVEDNEE